MRNGRKGRKLFWKSGIRSLGEAFSNFFEQKQAPTTFRAFSAASCRILLSSCWNSLFSKRKQPRKLKPEAAFCLGRFRCSPFRKNAAESPLAFFFFENFRKKAAGISSSCLFSLKAFWVQGVASKTSARSLSGVKGPHSSLRNGCSGSLTLPELPCLVGLPLPFSPTGRGRGRPLAQSGCGGLYVDLCPAGVNGCFSPEKRSLRFSLAVLFEDKRKPENSRKS